MNKSLYNVAAAIGFAALAMNAYADQGKGGMGMGNMSGMKMDCMKNMENMKDMKMDCMGNNVGKDSSKATTMSDGEVKGVDKANKNITLKHGPIKSKTIEMGPMTMSFPVQDPSLLSNVKVGDKVRFTAENVNDAATITSLIVQK
jgi:Cu(I)/Ag(I) efflux system protein CusF